MDNPDWSPEDREWLQQHMAALYQQDLDAGVSIDEKISRQMRDHIAAQTGVDMHKGEGTGKIRTLKPNRRWPAVAAAAVIFLIASTIYLTSSHKTSPTPENLAAKTHDASPGSNKATLTLADGSTIRLDSAAKGELLTQGNTRIIQMDTGLLTYRSSAPENLLSYNTITTPRGGQYQIVLSDGTHVWLNAASSLRFPAAFTGARRTVQLKGEAYFEVAAKHQPFTVQIAPEKAATEGSDTLNIDVLGTHFNVNAYANESTQTATLLQGSVRIHRGQNSYILKPGQQAIAARQDIRIDDNADLDEAIAWKNGMFIFNNLPLEAVMKQVERWYDMEVIYQGNPRNIVFNGQLSRYTNASRLLDLLQTTGEVHFAIENKKIIVRP